MEISFQRYTSENFAFAIQLRYNTLFMYMYIVHKKHVSHTRCCLLRTRVFPPPTDLTNDGFPEKHNYFPANPKQTIRFTRQCLPKKIIQHYAFNKIFAAHNRQDSNNFFLSKTYALENSFQIRVNIVFFLFSNASSLARKYLYIKGF